MTTDTHKKEYAIPFELGGKTCTVGAIGKGSGMIAPNMATMLAFYTTDAAVSPILLAKALKTVVPGTYKQMSVDMDTSTNDTLIIDVYKRQVQRRAFQWHRQNKIWAPAASKS